MCSIYNKIQNPMYVIWKVLMFFSAHLSNTTYQLCSHFPVCNILCCKNTVLFWGSMDFTVLGVLYTWWNAVCFWFCVRVSRMTDIHSLFLWQCTILSVIWLHYILSIRWWASPHHTNIHHLAVTNKEIYEHSGIHLCVNICFI